MPFINLEGKNNKLKLIFSIVLFVASFFAIKILFFSSKQDISNISSAQPSNIADAENIKISQINSDLLASQKFKDLQEFQFKMPKIEDIKKGNSDPFAEKIKDEKIEIDSAAIDKLYAEFTAELGVELNGEEKAKCLAELVKNNIASDKYYEYVKSCFIDKRNKILGQ
jgi:hypothetical protein